MFENLFRFGPKSLQTCVLRAIFRRMNPYSVYFGFKSTHAYEGTPFGLDYILCRCMEHSGLAECGIWVRSLISFFSSSSVKARGSPFFRRARLLTTRLGVLHAATCREAKPLKLNPRQNKAKQPINRRSRRTLSCKLLNC